MSSEQQYANHLPIFRTDQLWQFDTARDALKENDIPFYGQSEGFGGMPTAVSAAPTQAPGVFWTILVPQESWDRANETLSKCRLETLPKPFATDEIPDPEARSFWSFYGRFLILLAAVLVVLWAVLSYR